MKKLPALFLFLAILTLSFGQNPDLKWFKNLKPRNLGPAGMSGRVTCIDAVHNNPDIIFVGTASGGLWKTTSGGTDWQPIFEEQPTQSIGAVAIVQKTPDVIWAGTGEGNPRNSHTSGGGIFKSLDGGRTWNCMGLEETKTIHRILVHRDNPDIVYVAAMGSVWGQNEERGVFRTMDGGKSWEKVLYVNAGTGCADLVMDPKNPNKLVAAMWEYGRKPWFFESGGRGSGLYVTFDGGETWQKKTEKDGLPKGNLGRMGLAIAPSDPRVIYALIEAKPTGLYRSTDGGAHWHLQATENIGNRPFYYADIFVDPQNENRIYNLWSQLSRSEDGGKTFSVIANWNEIHPDHHAFWVHPQNPDFLIEGNDGGLAISRDRAQTWRFVENLPVGQFYHINFDNDLPYHVYGGMQDNGSWRGPSKVWRNGGIRNSDWQELVFGDGFDVVPHPANSRFGYAMFQGGNVYRYDAQTGHRTFIQPQPQDSVALRFNWNAAIAIDPFHLDGLYFGSQFLHHSTDQGQSWRVLSPDLTTNDRTKQRQAESGGITIDATRAENHTTIVSIAPSPLDRQVIWVGTDDGRLQLTRNGGTTWNDLYEKLPDAPKGGWIPQIVASQHNPGEAFVVLNHYRRNDWAPYLFHTPDHGKTWKNLTKGSEVRGHCHAIAQDPVAQKLLFLGTENGLWISFDRGKNWQQWKNGFPSVPTTDLKIHPREHDLIIGTFGRAAWILDDIRPLRKLALQGNEVLEKNLELFEIPDAYAVSYRSYEGTRFGAGAHFIGENASHGASFSFWVKPALFEKDAEEKKEAGPKDSKVHFVILAESGDTIRNFTTQPDTGMNRVHWRLRRNWERWPGSTPKPDADPPGGPQVAPGTYTLHLIFGKDTASQTFKVLPDPRSPFSGEAQMAKEAKLLELRLLLSTATQAWDRLVWAEKTVEKCNSLLEDLPESEQDSLKTAGKECKDAIQDLMAEFVTPKDFEGYDHVTPRFNQHLGTADNFLTSNTGAPGENGENALKNARTELTRILGKINGFFGNDWPAYEKQLKPFAPRLFRELEPIQVPAKK